MNVFVLCTGRSGSKTFIKACEHITNYTAAHESRAHLVGNDRLNYPQNHIEADMRLSWFLGRLDRAYGDNAIYVHLTRDQTETARSFIKRWNRGIMKAYRTEILMGPIPRQHDRLAVCLDCCDTVNSNIDAFLKDKSKKMKFSLENAKEDFVKFWSLIGAQGDFSTAVAEWDKVYNASSYWDQALGRLFPSLIPLGRRIRRQWSGYRRRSSGAGRSDAPRARDSGTLVP